MKKINSTKIANELGVSQASISRAFDLKSSMARSRRTQILKYCIENEYRVKDAKKMLEDENPIRVAFLINELHNPFFSSLLNDFSAEIGNHKQYLLEIHIVANYSRDYLEKLLKNLKSSGVQAIITASHLSDTFLPDVALETKIPIIAINRSMITSNASSVASDNFKNAYKVTEYLYEKGHRNIMFIQDDKGIKTMNDRLLGIQNFVNDRLEISLQVLSCNPSYEGAYLLVENNKDVIDKNGITAIIGGNDIMAIGAIDSLKQEYMMSVPDDMAVFGFDDIPMASWEPYQLSTVRQRTGLMSQETIEVLDLLLNKKEAGLDRKSQGVFIIRKSA